MELHDKIKILRKKKGISQKDLADHVGLHLSHLSRLENGHYQPSLAVLKKLVELFEVSADYLLDDSAENYQVKIKDKGLAERMKMVDTLEDDDRRALIQVIDCMLTKRKMLALLTKGEMVKEGV